MSHTVEVPVQSGVAGSHPLERLYLRLSLTSACNLRCRYCMPATGHPLPDRKHLATDDELLELAARINAVRPVHKLRITGGEPLIRPTAVELIGSLHAALPEAHIAMTSNATLLADKAADLAAAGLRSINISIDAATEQQFAAISRRNGLQRVLDGARAASHAGLRIKLNTVLLRHYNGSELVHLVNLAADLGAEIRFIELMPLGEGKRLHDHGQYLDADEALETILTDWQYLGSLDDGATSKRHLLYRDDRQVTIGFIRTMSQPFCSTCDRMRIDATGTLYTCLRNQLGINLLSPLRRGDARLDEMIEGSVSVKYHPRDYWPDRDMVHIGG